MRKFLLPLLLILTSFCVKADLIYGLCGDEISGVGTGMAGANYSAAIEVPEPVAMALAGSKVTKVSVGFKSGVSKVINVYLTYDLEAEPFYTQEGRVKVNTFTDTELETPYVIEGRKFYIGYTYRQSSSTGNPIGFDAADMGGMSAFSNLAAWADGGTPEWSVYPQFGALSLRATIEGETDIQNCLIPVGLRMPKAVNLGKEFDYYLDVLNYSSNPISSVEVISVLGDGEPFTQLENLENPIAPGQRSTITLSASTATENPEMGVLVEIPRVNGADNLWADNPSTATLIASNFIFQRVVVIEEATGIGCGYCPAGYVALEQMRERHPDDYIGIAVHNYTGDPMNCASYEPWVARNINGYPNATISRNPRIGTFSPQPSTCEGNYQSLAGVLNLRFEIQSEYADDSKTSARIATYTRFGSRFNFDGHKYGIALVETEDNVGPYSQSNYYSGGSYGAMYGFENMGPKVQLMYNDVARGIYNWLGKENSFPTEVKGGTGYLYNDIIPLKTSVSKHADANIIALLIDRTNGEIVTAAKCKLGKITEFEEYGDESENSVGELVSVSSSNVWSTDGGIVVEGDFDNAEIFRIDGTHVASLPAPGRVDLPKGIYMVLVKEGERNEATKVIVK